MSRAKNFGVAKVTNKRAKCKKKNYLFFLPIRKIHSREDQDGTKQEPDGNLFVKKPPGKQDGGDRIEIHPVSSHNSPQPTDHPVPYQVAEQRSHDT